MQAARQHSPAGSLIARRGLRSHGGANGAQPVGETQGDVVGQVLRPFGRIGGRVDFLQEAGDQRSGDGAVGARRQFEDRLQAMDERGRRKLRKLSDARGGGGLQL